MITLIRAALVPIFLSLPPLASSQPSAAIAIPDQAVWKQLREGTVVLLSTSSDNTGESADSDKSHFVTAAILINSPLQPVWNLIDDKEAAPAFIKNLRSATIVGEAPDHVLIEQEMKVGPLPVVNYVIKHAPSHPHTVEFERHSGDLKEIKGFWKFFPVDGDSKTLLVYRLSLTPDFPVPGFVVKTSLKKSLPEALEAIRTQVEKEPTAAE